MKYLYITTDESAIRTMPVKSRKPATDPAKAKASGKWQLSEGSAGTMRYLLPDASIAAYVNATDPAERAAIVAKAKGAVEGASDIHPRQTALDGWRESVAARAAANGRRVGAQAALELAAGIVAGVPTGRASDDTDDGLTADERADAFLASLFPDDDDTDGVEPTDDTSDAEASPEPSAKGAKAR